MRCPSVPPFKPAHGALSPPPLALLLRRYETSLVRHGLMMVGPAGGGKTSATRVLIDALTACQERNIIIKMNPKAIRAEEMFGQNDVISGEWTHGIFSSICTIPMSSCSY